jgi:hypothetical protein
MIARFSISAVPALAVLDRNASVCLRLTPIFGRTDKLELSGREAPYQDAVVLGRV